MQPAEWYVVTAPLVGQITARPGDVVASCPVCPVLPLVVFRPNGVEWVTVGRPERCDLTPYLAAGLMIPRHLEG